MIITDCLSRNGKILSDIIEERNLKVVNSSEKCTGTITRSKTTSKGIEQSVIDYVVVSENMYNSVEKMNIDEEKEKVLTIQQVDEFDANLSGRFKMANGACR